MEAQQRIAALHSQSVQISELCIAGWIIHEMSHLRQEIRSSQLCARHPVWLVGDRHGSRSQQQQHETTVLLAAGRVAVATSETRTVPGRVINDWCNGGYESTFRKPDGWIKLAPNAACQRRDPSRRRTKGQSILLNKSQRRREYSGDGLCVQCRESDSHTHTHTSKKNTKHPRKSYQSAFNEFTEHEKLPLKVLMTWFIANVQTSVMWAAIFCPFHRPDLKGSSALLLSQF